MAIITLWTIGAVITGSAIFLTRHNTNPSDGRETFEWAVALGLGWPILLALLVVVAIGEEAE